MLFFSKELTGGIIFSIPYEYDFTLIGTTDADHDGIETKPTCSDVERIISSILHRSILLKRYLRTMSYGVIQVFVHFMMMVQKTHQLPLAIMFLKLEHNSGSAPLLNIFGGKITTYRKLAEAAIAEISKFLP